MSSQVNPSTINSEYPVPGVQQSSQGFRSNFLATQNFAIQYVVEMNDVINKAIVSAPLLYGNGSNINNFGGMQNSNLSLFDYGLVVSDISVNTSNSVPTLDFTKTSVANISITAGSSTVQTINISNFPGIGYSEIKLKVQASTVPQYLNFSAIVPGGTINTPDARIAGFNSSTANFAISYTKPYMLTLGSSDGLNWILSADSTAVAKTYTPATSVGAPGDTAGMISYDSSYLYVCISNYDGTTHIWQRIASSTF